MTGILTESSRNTAAILDGDVDKALKHTNAYYRKCSKINHRSTSGFVAESSLR
jgi:hypothetical protein